MERKKNKYTPNFLYLGILIDNDLLYLKLSPYLKKLKEKINSNEIILPSFDNFNENESNCIYKFAKHFHITTLFLGKKNNNKNNNIYKNFVNGKKTNVKIFGLIIIYEKIMILICKSEEEIDNKFPHITFMIGKEYKPVNSNDVLETLFEKNEKIKNIYEENVIKEEKNEIFMEFKEIILGKEEKGLIWIFNEIIDLEGELKGFKY